MDLKTELCALLKGDIADDKDILTKYSRDASLFQVKPWLVVFPKDAEDLKNLVLFAQKHSVSLTCRGGGSDMTGGPLGEGIVLDMTRYFNRIKETGENFAVAEAGVFYRDFEKEVAKRNLLLPCFPASKGLCTLGGMVGDNAGGEKTLRYGKTEDYAEELKVILADGNEYVVKPLSKEKLEEKIAQNDFEGNMYRNLWKLIETHGEIIENAKPKVSKNSAGYALWNIWNKEKKLFDLTKLFSASQGTLGIITEIKFRLVVPSQHSALLVIFLPTLDLLVETVSVVLKHKPEIFESYDDHTFQLAIHFFSDFLKLLKVNLLTLALRFLPEFFMVLRGGDPKLILLAEFTADSLPEASQKAAETRKELDILGVNSRISIHKGEIEKYLTIRRESFNVLRRHPRGLKTAPFIDDIIVRPEYLEEFLPKLTAILSQYPEIIYTIAGHAGDGNFHIIPLMDFKKPNAAETVIELAQKVFALTLQFKGSLTAEHSDGLIRTPFLKDMFGEEVVKIFRETKQIFDPQNIFNPGKKVGGSLEFALSHIVS